MCDGLLPQISSDFHVTTGAAAQVITAYSASYGLLQIAFGLLGDRIGKERALVLATATSLFTTLACGVAATLSSLIWARLFAGATASGIIPLSLAWIGDNVPYRSRQTLIARFITGQIGGVIVGLAFGGAIGDWLGWRAAFWLIATFYVVATGGLLFQFNVPLRAPVRGRSSVGSLVTITGILRRSWARTVLLTTFFEGLLCFGALAYVTSTLHARFGLSFAAAGGTLAAFGVGGLIFSALAPRLIPRLGEAGGARVGALLLFFAFLGFAVMPNAIIGAGASLCAGVGYYFLHNVLQVNASEIAPDTRGVAVALFATSFFVGQGLGVAIAAPVVDIFGTTPIFFAAAVLLPVFALIFARALERQATTQDAFNAK